MATRIRSVAVVGGGPAGATLATYLAKAGIRVALFTARKRPPIIIGESLVPAVIPVLRDLGIESEVRDYSIFKPGATFVLDGGEQVLNLRFDEVRKATTTYSYNVPRDRLDASILEAARRAGAEIIHHTAHLEREDGTDRVRLARDTLTAAGDVLGGQPDWIVDATGRSRVLPRLLDLPSDTGNRKDTALFAHCEDVPVITCGNVHTDVLERGWSWRIPLQGRVSVGLVVPTDYIEKFGDTPAEQFDTYLAHDKVIRRWGGSPKRITPVLRYSNYQLASRRGVGDGWALVGDAFGFVDPVFSSGMLVGLDSARVLSKAILKGTEHALRRYEAHVLRHLGVWHKVVDHFYSGRLFTLFRVAEVARTTWMGRSLDFHFRKHMPRVFTGETSGRYSVGLLNFMCDYALAGNDPRLLEVR